jgi:hypothetical protein
MFRSFCITLMGYCAHQRTTFPITPRGSGTYVCCLDCGREFNYDWDAMRVTGPCKQPGDIRVMRALQARMQEGK